MDPHQRCAISRVLATALPATRRLAATLGLGVALLLALPLRPTATEPIAGTPPYPPSDLIASFQLDWSTLRRLAPGSDLWLTTWAADGRVYTAWGDGGGLGGTNSTGRVSIGVARLSGNSAATVQGRNLIGGVNYALARCFPRRATADLRDAGRQCDERNGLHGKAFGLLALGGTLHAFVSPGSAATNYREARLFSAPLGTNYWRRATWAFTRNAPDRLISVAFLQAGQDLRHAPTHVYAYAPRYAPVDPSRLSIQKGSSGGEIALMRAPRGADLQRRDSWRFFAGHDAEGGPLWTSGTAALRPAIVVPQGVGWISSAVYVEALKRYLAVTEYETPFAGRFLLLEAPAPEGPWRTVAQTTLQDPLGRVDGSFFYYSFLANSFSADGTRFTLVLTGSNSADAMILVDGSFALASVSAAAP